MHSECNGLSRVPCLLTFMIIKYILPKMIKHLICSSCLQKLLFLLINVKEKPFSQLKTLLISNHKFKLTRKKIKKTLNKSQVLPPVRSLNLMLQAKSTLKLIWESNQDSRLTFLWFWRMMDKELEEQMLVLKLETKVNLR